MIPRIREVHIRNYKSIEQASVSLSEFTVLVGANGSGKSNFVDALAFIQECLSTTVEAAIRTRGGVFNVRRNPAIGQVAGVELRVIIEMDHATVAEYGFELEVDWIAPPEIVREYCRISSGGQEHHSFEVVRGTFLKPIPGVRPVSETARLMLYAASAVPEFQPVYSFLTAIRLYAIEPAQLREFRRPEGGLDLERQGANASSVLRVLEQRFSDRHERIAHVLERVVPGLRSIRTEDIGNMEAILFQEDSDDEALLTMDATNASDGTLRMLGILLAVYQPTTPAVLLVEEPESTIHPAAADVLVSVLMDAAKRSQVVITTHSPDVLDNTEITDEMLRVVSKPNGKTVVTPISSASRMAVQQHLYSPGELLRMDELNPEIRASAPEMDHAENAG